MNDVLKAFEQSNKRLKEALKKRESMLSRDASILRFEFTFELAWKATQKILRAESIVCQSPRSCFQEAFTLGIVEDDPKWIRMLEDRNLVVHSYDEELAQSIYKRLPDYVPLFEALLTALKNSSRLAK